ncbi:MAG: hypothetical protein LAN59_13990 [Acidobacteriia bacterium]|nr:hypothetical protein [Terriglobia bacterium]
MRDLLASWRDATISPPACFSQGMRGASSDRGILVQGRRLKTGIHIAAEGGYAIGVCLDPAKALGKIRSGNFYLAQQQA